MSTSLTSLMQKISARFDQSGDTISSTSDEWTRRKRIINEGEEQWREFKKGKWNALLTSTSLTTVSGQAYITLPADYKQGAALLPDDGFITINSQDYEVVDKDEQLNRNSTDLLIWFTGNEAAGYRLNIQPTPSSTVAFTFDYFSKYCATDATGLVSQEFLDLPADITKCPNPTYLVNYALAELFSIDDEEGKGAKYEGKATLNLTQMSELDEQGEVNQTTVISDLNESLGYESYGGTEDDR